MKSFIDIKNNYIDDLLRNRCGLDVTDYKPDSDLVFTDTIDRFNKRNKNFIYIASDKISDIYNLNSFSNYDFFVAFGDIIFNEQVCPDLVPSKIINGFPYLEKESEEFDLFFYSNFDFSLTSEDKIEIKAITAEYQCLYRVLALLDSLGFSGTKIGTNIGTGVSPNNEKIIELKNRDILKKFNIKYLDSCGINEFNNSNIIVPLSVSDYKFFSCNEIYNKTIFFGREHSLCYHSFKEKKNNKYRLFIVHKCIDDVKQADKKLYKNYYLDTFRYVKDEKFMYNSNISFKSIKAIRENIKKDENKNIKVPNSTEDLVQAIIKITEISQ